MQIPDTLLIDGNQKPIQSNSYSYITTQTTTLVKTGAGVLHSITFNNPTATATVKIVDGLSDTTPVIALITVPASPQPVSLFYDVIFTTGLTVVTGVASCNITVSYL